MVLALTNNIAHDTNGLLINELSEVAPHSSNIFEYSLNYTNSTTVA